MHFTDPRPLVADLHIHSYLSRATSRECDLPHLALWAQKKGIGLLGTGDFTHPEWFARLAEELTPLEDSGLFVLREDLAAQVSKEVPAACQAEVAFVLQVEISSIYKRGGQVRKVHNLVYLPDLHSARRFRQALARIGNIESDGRPILGLDSRDLLEMVLECSERGRVIPAHIWTPWFSVFGSKSGFDALADCFGDLTPHLFALETGLSSDPPMNWRVSALDGLTLVSNSDAHSPAKLGREANLLRIALEYDALFAALASGDPGRCEGTLEFFPEEGKYHLDGCRRCGTRLTPEETQAHEGLCPGCGKKVTVGVMHRVADLADRPLGARPAGALPFQSLIPLGELLGECLGLGPGTLGVMRAYEGLLARLGSELDILRSLPLEALDGAGVPLLGEAVGRMREGAVHLQAGYDGEFGVVRAFAPGERERLLGQRELFVVPAGSGPAPALPLEPALTAAPASAPAPAPTPGRPGAEDQLDLFTGTGPEPREGGLRTEPEGERDVDPLLASLTEEQRIAVCYPGRALLVVAGPGTGKTRTLTHRLAWLVRRRGIDSARILALTFTHRAAGELRERLAGLLPAPAARAMTITTFHGLGLALLRRHPEAAGLVPGFPVLDEREALEALALESGVTPSAELRRQVQALGNRRVLPSEALGPLSSEQEALSVAYQSALAARGAVDFADLLGRTVALLGRRPELAAEEGARFDAVAVDELQDIDFTQRELLLNLCGPETLVSAIGDPDQSIYGFRGACARLFSQFTDDFSGCFQARLSRCFRSTAPILRAAQAVVAPAPDYGRVRLEPVTDAGAGRPVALHLFPDPRAEAAAVVRAIERLLGSLRSLSSAREEDAEASLGFGDIAVLARTRARLDPVAEALARAGIPVDRAGVEAPDLEEEETLLALCRAWIGQAGPLDGLRLLRHAGLGKRAAFGLCPALAGARSLPDLAGVASAAKASRSPRAAAERLGDWQAQLAAALGSGPMGAEITVVRSGVVGIPAALALARAAAALGLSWPPEPGSLRLARLWALGSSEPLSLEGLLDRCATETAPDRYQRAERVALLTLHAAKGLEFEAVFLVGCEDGTLPFLEEAARAPGVEAKDGLPEARIRSLGTGRASHEGQAFAEDPLHEERRLLYVGMTRARRQLWLGAARQLRRHGVSREAPASRFLEGLPTAVLERVKEGRERRRARQLDLV